MKRPELLLGMALASAACMDDGKADTGDEIEDCGEWEIHKGPDFGLKVLDDDGVLKAKHWGVETMNIQVAVESEALRAAAILAVSDVVAYYQAGFDAVGGPQIQVEFLDGLDECVEVGGLYFQSFESNTLRMCFSERQFIDDSANTRTNAIDAHSPCEHKISKAFITFSGESARDASDVIDVPKLEIFVAHELGHAFGLRHAESCDTAALMCDDYEGDAQRGRTQELVEDLYPVLGAIQTEGPELESFIARL